MQKILPIFLALLATLTVLGVVFLITRFGATWPTRIRTMEWRRMVGTAPDEPVEEPAAE